MRLAISTSNASYRDYWCGHWNLFFLLILSLDVAKQLHEASSHSTVRVLHLTRNIQRSAFRDDSSDGQILFLVIIGLKSNFFVHTSLSVSSVRTHLALVYLLISNPLAPADYVFTEAL